MLCYSFMATDWWSCTQFSSRKDEESLLRSTRINGVKKADRGFLAVWHTAHEHTHTLSPVYVLI